MNIKLLILAIICSVALPIAVSAQGKTGKPYSFSNLPVIKQVSFKKDTFNILKYGAKSDAQALNTKAINSAIADCSKKGGGVVVIPAGLCISGPVELKSNVNLHLNQGALLQFAIGIRLGELRSKALGLLNQVAVDVLQLAERRHLGAVLSGHVQSSVETVADDVGKFVK